MAETVWDNVSGAFTDLDESTQIGFTQDYSKLIPASVAGGAVGGAVVATRLDYTRFVVPFGRIFEGLMQSGLKQVFPNSHSCSDELCVTERLRSIPIKQILRVRISEFQVWEEPLNHLNFKAVVDCNLFPAIVSTSSGHSYTVRGEVLKQSVGSVMTTSSGFIKSMNRVVNQFASELSVRVLEGLSRQPVD